MSILSAGHRVRHQLILVTVCLALISGCSKMSELSRSSERLRNGTTEERLLAAGRLGELSDAEAISVLIQALNEKDSSVREAVTEAIRKKGAAAVDPLLAELQNPKSTIHRPVIELLADAKDPRAVVPFLALLRSGDADERQRVAEALGKIGKPAYEDIQSLLSEENPEVQPFVIKTLGAMGDDRAVPLLLAYLQNTSLEVRKSAIEALGRFNDPRVFDAVFPLLRDPVVRGPAVNTLGKVGSTRTAQIGAALKDQSLDFRLAVIEVLGKTHSAAALPILTAQLLRATASNYPFSDDDNKIIEQTEKAISELGPTTVAPLIELIRRNEDVWLDKATSDALRSNTDSGTVQLVIDELLSGRNETSGHTCALALLYHSRIGGEGNKDTNLGERSLNGILMALKSEKAIVRETVASAVHDDSSPLIQRELLAALEKRDLAVIKGGYEFFIKQGIPGSEDTLIAALNKSESMWMGQGFLNCGNEKLMAAARAWAPRHGYVSKRSDSPSILKWGAKR